MPDYNKKFLDGIFNINVKTNDINTLRLIDRQLDLSGTQFCLAPRFNISFLIVKKALSLSGDHWNFMHSNWRPKNTGLVSSFGLKIADVEVDHGSMSVMVEFCGDWEPYKERFLDFIFFRPIRAILERRGYFFVHAAALVKDDFCVFILGDQGCGKSALSLSLAQVGYRFLCDDDCFIGLKSGRLSVLPLRTKIGIKENALKKWPHLRRHIVRNYKYGDKKRFSLKGLYADQIDRRYVKYMILFPQYDAQKKINFLPLSQEKTLTRIMTNNLTANPEAKKFEGKKFLALYTLTKNAKAFGLVYSDKYLNQVCSILEGFY